jgi:hypothetical protein
MTIQHRKPAARDREESRKCLQEKLDPLMLPVLVSSTHEPRSFHPHVVTVLRNRELRP